MMKDFPDDFLWGVATASYQIEGAAASDGRAPSIWDRFCDTPGTISDGSGGVVACDHYHRSGEDLDLAAGLGIGAYRFSIAWPRLLPTGHGRANAAGIAFYDRLIDDMLARNLQPWPTLYHWDLPDVLETGNGGWRHRSTVDYFAEYAELCFDRFGDRVKHWITLNEPFCSAWLGYGTGHHAPGIRSADAPYLAGHHLLLAHAAAVARFRAHPASQDGQIGITLNSPWLEPLRDTPAGRRDAAQAMEFVLGWFAHPIWRQDYPQVMRDYLGDRLPTFTAEECRSLHGSADFFGLNHYNTNTVSNFDLQQPLADDKARFPFDCGKRPEWPLSHMEWPMVPDGFRQLLEFIADQYDNPPIYVTENGCAIDEPTVSQAVNDDARIDYYRGYLGAARQAIDVGVNLRGYFAWTLLDNFEWAFGYTRTFGLVHVNRDTLVRTPKKSAVWYRELAQTHSIPAMDLQPTTA